MMLTVSLLLMASLANALSQIFLKIGVMRLRLGACSPVTAVLRLAGCLHIWAGLLLFSLSLATYAHLISDNELSLIFPAMGATHLFVVAIAAWVLDERVNAWRLSGAGAIAIGLALLFMAEE